jgi:uncharacterized membrane protein
MGMLGGNLLVNIISKTGKDHLMAKGLFFGIGMGSVITALLSSFSKNRIRPKDAASNLSYMLSHAVYGMTAVYAISKLGHPSLFDTQPLNDYLPPTFKTTARRK